jgi:hypothetical protein
MTQAARFRELLRALRGEGRGEGLAPADQPV